MGGQARLTNRRFRMFLTEFKSLMEAYSARAAGIEAEFDWVKYEEAQTRVWQKRDDRIDTAIACHATLHNLLRMSHH